MIIDAFEFARKGLVASGSVALQDLPRLDVLERSGSLHWQIDGCRDADGKPFLRLAVRGQVVLACQRCLEPLVHDVALGAQLFLARSEQEANELPLDDDEFDFIVATPEVDVEALVEEEVLLGLPLVPKHARCVDEAAGDGQAEIALRRRASPFAVLAGMKKGGTR